MLANYRDKNKMGIVRPVPDDGLQIAETCCTLDNKHCTL